MTSTSRLSREVDPRGRIDVLPIGRLQATCIGLCMVLGLLDGFDTQSIAYVAGAIAHAWVVPITSFGLVFSVGLVGLAAGAMLIAPLADRFGRKTIVLFSTLDVAVFSFLAASSQHSAELSVYRFFVGVGTGSALPCILALVTEFVPSRRRATALTILGACFPLGAVIGGAITPHVISSYGWQAVFLIGGALPLLLLPVLAAMLPESIEFLARRGTTPKAVALMSRIDPAATYTSDDRFIVSPHVAKGVPVGDLFIGRRLRGTLLLWVAFFCNVLVMYFLLNWLPSLVQQAGLPPGKAVVPQLLLNIGGICGAVVLGGFLDRTKSSRMLGYAYVISAVSVIGIGLSIAKSFPLLMFSAFVGGFFVIGVNLCMNAVVATFYPVSIRSTGLGWALGLGRAGSILGPLFAGFALSAGSSAASVFVWSGAPLLIAAAAVFGLSAVRDGDS